MNILTLLADPAAIQLEKIISEPQSLTLVVASTRRGAKCPKCDVASKRIHSRYVRTVADLPCHGIAVRLQLRTRRFRCTVSLRQRGYCWRILRSSRQRHHHPHKCRSPRLFSINSTKPIRDSCQVDCRSRRQVLEMRLCYPNVARSSQPKRSHSL